MNNIILTSNGFNNLGNRSKEIDELFENIAKGKQVLIVANAAKKSNFVSKQDVKDNFEKAGAAKVDLIDFDKENLEEILNYDVMYVIGGDVGELIDLNNTTDFKKYLFEFLKAGVYIGESAGSIIMGKDCKWLYDIKKGTRPKFDIIHNSYKGFGLTEFNIFPHFNLSDDEEKEKINQYEKMFNMKITRLNDGEFIRI